MALDFTKPADLRARFKELQVQRDAIIAQSAPKRTMRDDILRASTSQVAIIDAEVKAIEAPLFDLDQEAGLIARALGGRTGE